MARDVCMCAYLGNTVVSFICTYFNYALHHVEGRYREISYNIAKRVSSTLLYCLSLKIHTQRFWFRRREIKNHKSINDKNECYFGS